MASEGTVLWKCGACEDCFYDLQALASHKCIGNTGTITLSEQCIKQLDEHSFATADIETTSEQVEQAISAIAALEEEEEEENNGFDNEADNSAVTYAASVPHKRVRKAKPTIISINNSLASERKFKTHQKGKRSLVWAYFTALDCKKAMCCICQKVIAYCGTPTNLVYHLNRFHPSESEVVKSKHAGRAKYQYLENKIPKGLAHCRAGKKSILKPIKRPIVSSLTVQKKTLTDRIVELIAVDLLPSAIVEGQGFKNFVQAFEPYGQVPDAKKVLKDLMPKRYYEESKKVKELLGTCSKIHLSVELWTGFGDDNFLTVTAHFITDEFEVKCYTLGTSCLSVEQSPQLISTALLSCVSDWDIASQVMCIVSDGQENISNAIKLNQKNIHLICLAHVLNKIIKETFAASPELNKLIHQCRSLVAHLKQNDFAKQKLMELQTQDKHLQSVMRDNLDFGDAKTPSCPLKAIKDVPGHWITMFHMLQRIFTLRNVINIVLEDNSSWNQSFTENDWLAIEETISLLKAFEVVTLELCTERYPSLSKVIPIVQGLLSLVHNCSNLSLNYVERVRKDLLAHLRHHLGHVEQNITLAVATVLDPRFKNIAFQSDDAVDAAVQSITMEGRKYKKLDSLDSETETKNISGRLSSSYTDSLWASFDKKATPRKEAAASDDLILNEIKNYFDEPLIDRKKKPIVWWRDTGSSKFPVLAEIAKQMLSIPSTCVPPERVFMQKEQVFFERRRSIKSKYVNQLLFLSTNIE